MSLGAVHDRALPIASVIVHVMWELTVLISLATSTHGNSPAANLFMAVPTNFLYSALACL
jgi:hypothetical protein